MAMKKKTKLWIVLLGIAVLLVTVIYLFFSSSHHGKHTESGSPPAGPARVILSIGSQESLAAPAQRGGARCYVFGDGKGQRWAIFNRWTSLEVMVRRGSDWEGMTDVTPSGWKFINRMAVAADSRGDPILIMAAYDDSTGEAVAALHWTGSEWGTPVYLDRLQPGKSVNVLDAVTDAEGRIHVAYDRPLARSETYNTGGHGAFPHKCFHVFFNGKTWSKPQPTTGRGRYSVDDLTLSTSQDGRVCLSYLVGPISGWGSEEGKYVACQFWKKGRWSKPERATPKHSRYIGGMLVMDGWGQEHVWTHIFEGDPGGWQYSRPTSHDAGEADGPRDWGKPSVRQMPNGKLAVIGQGGKVYVWNGRRWSRPVKGGLPGLGVLPNGNLLTWYWRGTELEIREVVVKED